MMKKVFFLIIIAIAFYLFLIPRDKKHSESISTTLGHVNAFKLGTIPEDAAIIFWSTRNVAKAHILGPSNIFVMNIDGGNVTQVSFTPHDRGQAAVSPDRKKIVATRKSGKQQTLRTTMWLLDIEMQIAQQLVPEFHQAGSGGVEWTHDNWIYFKGEEHDTPEFGDDEVYRIRPDGSSLIKLTNTPDMEVGDVSVSEDGSLVAHVGLLPVKIEGTFCPKPQIWVFDIETSRHWMVDDGGTQCGKHRKFPLGDFDPEISPDNQEVVFSRSNDDVPRNFPDSLNTAHDIWIAPLDGSEPAKRITEPGSISIIPDWQEGRILYTEYDERGNYVGLVTINPDGTNKKRLEQHDNLLDGGRHGKFIPHLLTK